MVFCLFVVCLILDINFAAFGQAFQDYHQEALEDSNEHTNEDTFNDRIQTTKIYINRSTILLKAHYFEYDDFKVRAYEIGHGHRQTTFINEKEGTVAVISSRHPSVCIIYNKASSTYYTDFTTENYNTNVAVGSAQKCLYEVTRGKTDINAKYEHICEGRKIQHLNLLSCKAVEPNDIELPNLQTNSLLSRRNLNKRATCLPAWETYRIETTCYSSLFYQFLFQRTCVTHNEIFSQFLCVVEYELN